MTDLFKSNGGDTTVEKIKTKKKPANTKRKANSILELQSGKRAVQKPESRTNPRQKSRKKQRAIPSTKRRKRAK